MHVVRARSEQKNGSRYYNSVMRKADVLLRMGDVPDVNQNMPVIERLCEPDYLKGCGPAELDNIRRLLRGLMPYIGKETKRIIDTNFKDEIMSQEIRDSDLRHTGNIRYREKMKKYLHENENEPVIMKLKTNQPLSSEDVAELERIMWMEVGTKEEYIEEYGGISLGVLVRRVTGLDKQAALDVFSKYLDHTILNENQRYFVGMVVDYIVKNGTMDDFGVLKESPFSDRGSFADLFVEPVWKKIMDALDEINTNAIV